MPKKLDKMFVHFCDWRLRKNKLRAYRVLYKSTILVNYFNPTTPKLLKMAKQTLQILQRFTVILLKRV